MDTPSGSGVLYCATRDAGYLAQAFVAARSVKKYMLGVPVALFTDMPNHALARLGDFDDVLDIDIENRFVSSWATGKLPRIVALTRSPFAKTLHLDCDTRITDASAMQIFEILDTYDIAMVECQPGESFSRTQYGGRMFNGGMVAFRNTAETQSLFERWYDLTLGHHRMGDAIPLLEPPAYLAHITDDKTLRRLLKMDQISLAQLLSPDVNVLGLNFILLDDVWNARKPARLQAARQTIKINHAPENRSNAWSLLIAEAEAIAQEGDKDRAHLILAAAHDHTSANVHAGGSARRGRQAGW